MSKGRRKKNESHISVCICTYKRPEMLSHALEGILKQVVDDGFTYEIVIVDNDRTRSAEPVVLQHQNKSVIPIMYSCETEQNIALARNRAIRLSTGNLIAFIDDDECPVKEWLARLYNAKMDYKADGALGPVLPEFPPESPRWLREGNIFNRRRFLTGTKLTVRDTRTGNVLLSRSMFPENEIWFDPAFGLTGGEDVDFFRRQISLGRIFVWCDEAEAYETVTADRCKSSFHLKKYFKIGALNGENLRKDGFSGFIGFFKCILSVLVWSISFIALLPLGKHRWISPILKLSYSSSCVLSYCGIQLEKNRY
ncbi:MAG: glycosyltransferase family 2 protein [Syntrophaceae bacterium]|nr:glycosyltransferase family 2 protein [Syntrophaceae bacterium]